ncbi:MAG: hypothetical protein ACLGIN_07010 [Candidatus Sericytochromatia bacterium]
MALRSIPWVLAAAIGVMGASPALACEEGGKAKAAHAGHGGKMEASECAEDCECPMCEAKRDRAHGKPGKGHGMHGGKGHGMHGGKGHGMHGRRGMGHRFAPSAEIRYLPAAGASTNQHLILAGGPQVKVNDWFSMGWQRNLGVQLFPQGPEGVWVSPYGGVLPRIGTSFGPTSVHVGSLLGAGAMLRTTGIPSVSGDYLQAKVMWVVEPRIELGWKADNYNGALVGTYLLTPNMSEFGGATVGLKFSFKGHPFMHH